MEYQIGLYVFMFCVDKSNFDILLGHILQNGTQNIMEFSHERGIKFYLESIDHIYNIKRNYDLRFYITVMDSEQGEMWEGCSNMSEIWGLM